MARRLRRGDIYRVVNVSSPDPRSSRPFVIVSRRELLDSHYSTVVCVPVYSVRSGAPTEVHLDESDGLRHPSAARCDEVTSVARVRLTEYVGHISPLKAAMLNGALMLALDIGAEDGRVPAG